MSRRLVSGGLLRQKVPAEQCETRLDQGALGGGFVRCRHGGQGVPVAAHRVGDTQEFDGIEGAPFRRLRHALAQEVVGKEISPDGGWSGRVHPGRVADIACRREIRWIVRAELAIVACARAKTRNVGG